MPNTSALGKKGEEEAAAFLQSSGIEIITRNYRSRYGEIDIIAKESETIIFVEVKTWSSIGFTDLQYSIDIKKQKKIIKTAKYFLLENREYSNMSIRFDVVFIGHEASNSRTPDNFKFNHLVSAFTESV
ncbi:MAG: YraN family protein [Treponema sp.]|nr:YraN family protein [Treponema sp.]